MWVRVKVLRQSPYFYFSKIILFSFSFVFNCKTFTKLRVQVNPFTLGILATGKDKELTHTKSPKTDHTDRLLKKKMFTLTRAKKSIVSLSCLFSVYEICILSLAMDSLKQFYKTLTYVRVRENSRLTARVTTTKKQQQLNPQFEFIRPTIFIRLISKEKVKIPLVCPVLVLRWGYQYFNVTHILVFFSLFRTCAHMWLNQVL